MRRVVLESYKCRTTHLKGSKIGPILSILFCAEFALFGTAVADRPLRKPERPAWAGRRATGCLVSADASYTRSLVLLPDAATLRRVNSGSVCARVSRYAVATAKGWRVPARTRSLK